MALDLSNILGGNKTVPGQEGLKGDGDWLGQTLGKVWNSSTPGMIGSTFSKMGEGQNLFEAAGNTMKESHGDRMDVVGAVANGAATFYSGGQVDARGPINGIKNALGGNEDYTVATDNVQKIGSAASGNPGEAMSVARDTGMGILKDEGVSFLGGKSGGGVVEPQDVKGFQAMFQTRQELGNDGIGLDGPKIDKPTLQMPTLGRK